MTNFLYIYIYFLGPELCRFTCLFFSDKTGTVSGNILTRVLPLHSEHRQVLLSDLHHRALPPRRILH